jgi:hypothetical protein
MPIISDSDKDFLNLKSIIKRMDNTTIKTGWIDGRKGNRRSDSKEDNISIATKLQFIGVGRQKKKWRFMEPAFDKNKDKYSENIKKTVHSTLQMKKYDVFDIGTKAVGMQMKADMQAEIRSITSPALEPETIKIRRESLSKGYAKGKDLTKPLIWSGNLKNSINYFINKR